MPSLRKLSKTLEARLGVSTRYLIDGNFWLAIAHGTAILCFGGLSLLFGNLLTRDVYGQYAFVISAAAIIGSLSLTGFRIAVSQSAARGRDGGFFFATWETLRWSVLVLVVALGAALYWELTGHIAYALCFVAMGLTLPFYKTAGLFDAYLLGRKNFKASGLINALVAIGVAGAAAVALFAKLSLVWIVAAYFGAQALVTCAAYLWVVGRYPPRNTDIEDGFFRHAVSLSGTNVLAAFADEADSVLLFFFIGPTQLAVYSFAVAVPEMLKGFFRRNIAGVMLPAFSTKTPADLRRSLISYIALGTVAALAIAGVYIVIATWFFRFLLPQYQDAVLYSQVAALSMVVAAAGVFPATALRALQETKALYYRFIVVAELFQIAALLVGIYFFGIWGAIGAYIVVRVFRLLYASYLLYRTA